MKSKVYNFIHYILWKVYSRFKTSYCIIEHQQGLKKISSKCFFSFNSQIEHESLIINNSGNKEAIIIGENTYIRGELLVYDYGGRIKVGNDCFIGQGSKIWSSNDIIIGDRVLISHNVNIHDNNSHPLNSVERHNHYKHVMTKGLSLEISLNEKKIVISDDVWIGFNSTVLKGVKIGRGAIIGSNTVVTRDVPENAVVVGSPGVILNK
jgi:acetyltransferase-like isoleucine patch superfamily enzyme